MHAPQCLPADSCGMPPTHQTELPGRKSEYILPAPVGMKQTKDECLSEHCQGDAAGQILELTLEIASQFHFLANAG
jgi:hypothetical protein